MSSLCWFNWRDAGCKAGPGARFCFHVPVYRALLLEPDHGVPRRLGLGAAWRSRRASPAWSETAAGNSRRRADGAVVHRRSVRSRSARRDAPGTDPCRSGETPSTGSDPGIRCWRRGAPVRRWLPRSGRRWCRPRGGGDCAERAIQHLEELPASRGAGQRRVMRRGAARRALPCRCGPARRRHAPAAMRPPMLGGHGARDAAPSPPSCSHAASTWRPRRLPAVPAVLTLVPDMLWRRRRAASPLPFGTTPWMQQQLVDRHAVALARSLIAQFGDLACRRRRTRAPAP